MTSDARLIHAWTGPTICSSFYASIPWGDMAFAKADVVNDWCGDNLIGNYSLYLEADYIHIHFDKQDDQILFNLRW